MSCTCMLSSNSISLVNGLDKPTIKGTIKVKASCDCGYYSKDFEACAEYARENWDIVNDRLFRMAGDWLKSLEEKEGE
jgi:hypothetical protein